MTEPIGFFDKALAAADRLTETQPPDDVLLVVRALRESIALNRGIVSENYAYKLRVEKMNDVELKLSEVSQSELLNEVSRRMS